MFGDLPAMIPNSGAQKTEDSALLEMEARLRDDVTGTFRADLLARLVEQRTAVRRRLDAGVAPEDFRRLSLVLDAFDAAHGIVENYRAPAPRR